MKHIVMVWILILICSSLGCTYTAVHRVDGDKEFRAHNISWGWERKNVNFDLLKQEDKVGIGISIGSSSGVQSFDRGVSLLEEALKTFKATAP